MSIRASFAVASNVPFVAGENTADGLSPGSQFLEDEKTLNIIAQTAKLTNHLLADYKNVNTQTPDEWMVDAAENALMIFDAQYFQHKAKPVKAEEELKQTEETVVPVVATTTTTTDVETKVENFEELHKDLPRLQLVGEPIASKYVMDVNTANTLIMLIYESRVSR